MISVEIKTDVKQEIKKLVAVSYNVSQKYLLKTCGWHSMQPDIYCPLRMGRISLFLEEISACTAVHTCYVMDVCDCVQSIILLPPVMGMSFVLVMLTRLIVSKPKHQVT